MKITLKILEEISDYIEMLDENVGLKAETIIDVLQAISKEMDRLKQQANGDVNAKDDGVCQDVSVLLAEFHNWYTGDKDGEDYAKEFLANKR